MVKAVRASDILNPEWCKERERLSMEGLSVGHDADVHDVQTTTITPSFVVDCCNVLLLDDDYSATNISKLQQLITNDVGAVAAETSSIYERRQPAIMVRAAGFLSLGGGRRWTVHGGMVSGERSVRRPATDR